MATSNTTRSKALMESEGWAVAVVEYWNAFTKRRHDLFGVWDLLCAGPSGTAAIQTTSRGNISSRARKIAESEYIAACRAAGWQLEIHGWDKYEGRWRCKRVDVS
jgi:hypothetical protein